ncbi:lipoprotein 17-related variable surface protein [Mycoplasmopsis opalescens]|uniref:lipoprotein 17-related variable surface protein n=1 Tax=Mycoplasmopsis opalescens TaxID=114886 RepID=UPI0004A7332B|nr:lipoprotein 17-related variable surface protein [Mycoplasmopsis opalescens]
MKKINKLMTVLSSSSLLIPVVAVSCDKKDDIKTNEKNYDQLFQIALTNENLKKKEAKDIKKTDLKIITNETSITFTVKEVKVKANENTTLQVTVEVKDANGNFLKSVVKEITGFKAPSSGNTPGQGGDQSSSDEDITKLEKKAQEAYNTFKEKITVAKSLKAHEFLSKAQNGTVLYWDYKKLKLFNEPYDKNQPDKPTRVALFEFEKGGRLSSGFEPAAPETEALKGENTYKKAILVKEGDTYSVKFRIGKFDYKSKKTTVFDVVKETKKVEFKVLSQTEIDAKAETVKLDYKNKSQTSENDIKQSDLIIPTIEGFEVEIKNFFIKSGEAKIEVEFVVNYLVGNDKVASKLIKQTIDGFIKSELAAKIKDVLVVYDGDNSAIEASKVTADKLKSKVNNQELDSSITVKYNLKANDYLGILSVEAEYKTKGETVSKKFTLEGFKKTEFKLDEFIEKYTDPKLKDGIDASKTPSNAITEESFTLAEYDKQLVDIQIKEVKVNDDDKSKVTLTLEFTDKVNNGLKKEKTYEFTGFLVNSKQYRDEQSFKLAEQGNFFVWKGSKENQTKILEFINKSKKNSNLLNIQNGTVAFNKDVWEGSSNKPPVEGLELKEEAKKHISTHGNDNTLAPTFVGAGKKQGTRKGIEIFKDDKAVYVKFLLVLADGKTDSKEYKIKLFDISE